MHSVTQCSPDLENSDRPIVPHLNIEENHICAPSVSSYQVYLPCFYRVRFFAACLLFHNLSSSLHGLCASSDPVLMHVVVSRSNSYYAGLWSGDLQRGLLWSVFNPLLRPTSEYIAPSWSWASRAGQNISSFFDKRIMCDPYSKTSPTWRELLAALEPQNAHVEIDLKYPDAKYGEVVAGRLHCSVRLLHGARVGKILRNGESIYGRPHPAYHRGIGGIHKDDFFYNRQLTVPVGSGVEHSKTMPIQSEGEIIPDNLNVAQFLCEKPSDLAGKDISIMLLWPFKFQGDRCIGLALLPADAERNEYKKGWEGGIRCPVREAVGMDSIRCTT